MISYQNEMEHGALVRIVREAYMELFPTASIEDRLDALEPGAYVAVTCSPSKGVDETSGKKLRLSSKVQKSYTGLLVRGSILFTSFLKNIYFYI